MSSRIGFVVAALAVAVGVGGLIVSVPVAGAVPVCPPGLVQDTQAPGFQCVPACPPGTLLDGTSQACVSAPGLPPPPLR